MRQRIFIILLALDHFTLALITLGGCKPYEMISSALWELEQDGRLIGRILRPSVDAVAWLLGSRNHCENSWLWQRSVYELKV